MFKRAVPKLRANKKLNSICCFLDLVAKDKFPMQNIAFSLFLDVVNYFSCENTCGLRYADKQTLLFWIFGYLLMHGKFLRFMSSEKGQGIFLDTNTKKGFISPPDHNLNLAVPSESVLRAVIEKKLNLHRHLKPGVLHDLTDTLTKKQPNQQYILSVDGKKIRSGLTETDADIDLETENSPK